MNRNKGKGFATRRRKPSKAAYDRASRLVGRFQDCEGARDLAENHDHDLVEAILERKGRRGDGRQ
jgi:hypothetical protein